jgi:enamine deaminase RidA (YjgF/YER057c/UK114 family)
VGLNLLASARAILGSLDRVRRVVKVLGMVNCGDDFGDQPRVMNGFSDLMVEVFGDAGRHARSAVGMAALPVGIPVEIELILEVTPPRRAAARPRPARPARRATPRRRRR